MYDVILIAGQSNTHFGTGYDPVLDHADERIFQLGRSGTNDYRVILAQEPLDHYTKASGKIGFALTFAKLYADAYLSENRKVLLIPCGKTGAGFMNNFWNSSNTCFQDAAARTRFVLNKYRRSKLVAILWHQGENDIDNLNYQADLDYFIQGLRNELAANVTPIILGGMVPYWVSLDSNRMATQQIIKETPERLPNVGYADPTWPYPIQKADDSLDILHYNAKGQRELGLRYFAAYVDLAD